MRLHAVILAVMVVACDGSSADRPRSQGSQSNENLVGTWDATLSLTQPYQLELEEPTQRRICGTIGFIVDRHPANDAGAGGSNALLGVYDLDLRAFGLGWFNDEAPPLASAVALNTLPSSTASKDTTLTITLRTGNNERIVFRGEPRQDEIQGAWTASSRRGSAAGSFLLRRHGIRQGTASC